MSEFVRSVPSNAEKMVSESNLIAAEVLKRVRHAIVKICSKKAMNVFLSLILLFTNLA